MRLIQYARKSSEGDERQVQSIPDQNAVLERLASQAGLNVVCKLEEAHSAKQPGARPIYEKMIALIRAGQADGILCWHINRLSRNPVDSGQLSWLLQQGIIKCIRTPEREYLPEDNVVIMAVENAVANQYIVDLRNNIRRAQLEKAARGWYPHKPPGGYFTNRDTGEIEVDGDRFVLLRKAWELMLSGAYSVPEVDRKLKAWGYRTRLGGGRPGKMLTRSNVYELFDNRFYLGEFTFLGQRYVGKHRPMVTREEFDRVQETVHGPLPIQPKRHYFAFTGLIRCGGCGCMITGERKVKHYRTTNRTVTYTYYRCTRSRACTEPAVTGPYIEGEIRAKLARCSLNPRAIAWAKDVLVDEIVGDATALPKVINRHKVDLAAAKRKLDTLYEMRLSGEISGEELRSLRIKCQEEISRHEGTIDRLGRLAERNRQTAENLFDFVGSAARLFDSGNEKTKREIARSLGEGYLLTLGKLDIRPHRLLEPLLAFEPPKTAKDMVRAGSPAPKNPFWCTWRDHIRTLLEDPDVSFPKLGEEQRVWKCAPIDVLARKEPPPFCGRNDDRVNA